MKRNNKHSTEIMLLQQAKKIHSISNSINKWMLPFAVILFIIIDFVTVFQMTDSIFGGQQILGILMTIGVVLILDLTPCAIGHFCQQRRKQLQAIVIFVIMMCAYTTIVFMQGDMRWESRQETFYKTEENKALDGIDDEETAISEYVPTKGQNAATIMFAILPVATSTLILYLSCAVSKDKKLKQQEELAAIELDARLKMLNMSIEELDQDLKIDLFEYDENMLQIMMQRINHYEEVFKNFSRQILALKISTPEAIGSILIKESDEE